MRVIKIQKIEDVTKVTIQHSATSSKKVIYPYFKGAEYELKKNIIIVRDLAGKHPLLTIEFEEIFDKLTATDIEEYFDKMIENFLFSVPRQGGGGTAPSAADVASGTFTTTFNGTPTAGYPMPPYSDPYIYHDGTATYMRIGKIVTLSLPIRSWIPGDGEVDCVFTMALPFPSANGGTTNEKTGSFVVVVDELAGGATGVKPGTISFITGSPDKVKFEWKQDWTAMTDQWNLIHATIQYEIE